MRLVVGAKRRAGGMRVINVTLAQSGELIGEQLYQVTPLSWPKYFGLGPACTVRIGRTIRKR